MNYETPELKEFGSFQDLTLTAGGGASDALATANSVNSPSNLGTAPNAGVLEK